MNIKSIFLSLSLLVIFSACSSDNETPVVSNPADKEINKIATKTAAIPSKEIILSTKQVGKIDSKTPFNLHKIHIAFPNYEVEQRTDYVDGNRYPIIRVSQGITPILSINPDSSETKIFSIIIHNNLVTNHLGHKIHSFFKDIYVDKKSKCILGIKKWAGKVMCRAPKSQNILYLFSGDWKQANGKMPADDILAQWKLEAIIWKPMK